MADEEDKKKVIAHSDDDDDDDDDSSDDEKVETVVADPDDAYRSNHYLLMEAKPGQANIGLGDAGHGGSMLYDLSLEEDDKFNQKLVASLTLPSKPTKPTSISSLPKKMLERDWNKEFQELVARTVNTPHERKTRAKVAQSLQKQFLTFTELVAQNLALEAYLPDDQKSIVQEKGMGVLGGDKYKFGYCFFKFARATSQVLPHDEAAHKVAFNEIRAANAVVEASIPNLHTILSASFSMFGHVVTALALCPINQDGDGAKTNTLVYGSADGGKTIEKHENKDMLKLVRELAERFNLKEHGVRSTAGGEAKNMYFSDVEVHHNFEDGRFYILDLGRFFPPMTKDFPGHPHACWYYQFRPEFMQHTCVDRPLSADALTPFGAKDSEIHDTEVTAAFKLLKEESIKSLAEELLIEADTEEQKEIQLRLRSETVLTSKSQIKFKDSLGLARTDDGYAVSISEILHRRGVNMRFLGLLFREVSQAPASDVRDLVLRNLYVEMIIRVIKRRIQRCFRLVGKHFKENVCEALYLQVSFHYFIMSVGGVHEDIDDFWQAVKTDIHNKFDLGFKIFEFVPSSLFGDIRKFLHVGNRAISEEYQFEIVVRLLEAVQVDWKDGIRPDKDKGRRNQMLQLCRELDQEDQSRWMKWFKHKHCTKIVKIPEAPNMAQEEERIRAAILMRAERLQDKYHPKLLPEYINLFTHFRFWVNDKAETMKDKADELKPTIIAILDKHDVPLPQVLEACWAVGDFYNSRAMYEESAEFYERALKAVSARSDSRVDVQMLDVKAKLKWAMLQRNWSDHHKNLAKKLEKTAKEQGTQDKLKAKVEAHKAKRHELLQAAEQGYKDALKAFEDHGITSKQLKSDLHNGLGWVYYKQEKRLEDAVREFELTLELRKQYYPEGHPAIAAAMYNVSSPLLKLKKLKEALSYAKACLKIRQQELGDDNVHVAFTLKHLSSINEKMAETLLDNDEETLRLTRYMYKYRSEALEVFQKAFQKGHQKILSSIEETMQSVKKIKELTTDKAERKKMEERYEELLDLKDDNEEVEHQKLKRVLTNGEELLGKTKRISSRASLSELTSGSDTSAPTSPVKPSAKPSDITLTVPEEPSKIESRSASKPEPEPTPSTQPTAQTQSRKAQTAEAGAPNKKGCCIMM